MLILDRVSYSYTSGPSPPLFRDLSLEVSSGEFVSLVGASGSGKSTLFKLIAGLAEPRSGEIRIGAFSSAKPGDLLGKTGYMPQKDLLLPWRTVLENARLASELTAVADSAYSADRMHGLLKRFGLEEAAGAYPGELSGGMRQRAAFLRTVATGRRLLLLDEPFGALDAITKQEMHRWLLSLWEELGVTVLFITHDLEEALLLSDRIGIMPRRPGEELQLYPVRLPRPRNPDARFEPGFLRLRREMEGRLRP
ncbi:ABC transporter ATP-binding protein [Gorillibacterium sp. sgz500922]|uniref:ABC transporter ATP-binding protein n=1 Tax=Gorillibacterium sp. sgz500922 TaxID=3446694 RepID=UPI003F680A47